MDETWRMRMGSTNLPRRRSTEEKPVHRIFDFGNNCSSDSETLEPEDFNDVFGGPPKTLLSRKASGTDLNYFASNFYQDVCRSSSEYVVPIKRGNRNLAVFSIPAIEKGVGDSCRRKGVCQRNENFYDDIFGSDEDHRSKLKSTISKSNSSSVLSSEDLSPVRPSIADDAFLSSFSSKLRPINIQLQKKSSSILTKEKKRIQGNSDICPWLRPTFTDSHVLDNDIPKNNKCSPYKFSQSGSSPESISIEPRSHQSIKASFVDIEMDSPSSVVSSVYNREPESKSRFQNKSLQEEDEDDEIMSSYVIEISCEKRKEPENDSVVAINEAIAWAKEKFQAQSSVARGGYVVGGCHEKNVSPGTAKQFAEREDKVVAHEHCNRQQDGHERTQFLMVNQKLLDWMTEEKQPSAKDGRFL
ncbi:Chaperone dnaj-domain superfamily protein [Thalictrum thalictroides]|uniref:Chaperone dnaj-domain superfamily protein n=1 Tax=Thalictrum thalictroides TaxID=46969 RepID=A0A7J6VYH6_THATH|nr:Chaperone dnaj-domain superfamily protein [Thalictrum thalictroides]